jgi:hypothetical protein
MLDAASPEMASRVRMDQYESIENVRAADHLDGLQILDALHRHGWKGLRRFRYGSDVMQFAAERVIAMFRNADARSDAQAAAARRPQRRPPLRPLSNEVEQLVVEAKKLGMSIEDVTTSLRDHWDRLDPAPKGARKPR